MAERRRGFGHIRKLPSGRYQASYIGPDQRRHNAPLTFAAKVDCEGWLSSERRLIERDEWESPLVRAEREALQQRAATDTLRAYADAWLADGTTAGRLRPLTVLDYRRSLDLHILPSLGDLQLADIVRGTVVTSKEFARFCKKNKIRRSLGRTGICYDNAVAESFFASYKKELIHTRPWPDLKSVKKATFEWIEMYYNRARRHSTLGYFDTPRIRARISTHPRTRGLK